MEIELQYKKAIEQYKLKESDLPEDAQTGIGSINELLRMFAMLEKNKGKQPTAKALKKLKAIDKWVYYEILDHVQGTDNNDGELPDGADAVDDTKKQLDADAQKAAADAKAKADADKAKADADKAAADKIAADKVAAIAATTQVTETDNKMSDEDKLALAIHEELESMFKSGQTEWDIEAVKPVAPKVYAELFDCYKEGEDNGVCTTTGYRLIETKPKVFTLTKV